MRDDLYSLGPRVGPGDCGNGKRRHYRRSCATAPYRAAFMFVLFYVRDFFLFVRG
jgi:hypothetical protein